MIKDKHILHNLLQQIGPTVFLPNNQSITSNATGNVPIPSLSDTSTQAHILPGLKNPSLLSLGQLCDDGCIVHLTKSTIHVFKNEILVLSGIRNPNDGLWDMPLPQQPQQLQQPKPTQLPSHSSCNVIIRKHKSKMELAQYLHACAFSPSPSTLITAIRKGHFITWPGLTPSLIQRHLPSSIFTAKGHLNQEMKHLQSTKKSYKDILMSPPKPKSNSHDTMIQDEYNDFHPSHDANTPKTFNCFTAIMDVNNSSTGFVDLTGRFTYPSIRGNQYQLNI